MVKTTTHFLQWYSGIYSNQVLSSGDSLLWDIYMYVCRSWESSYQDLLNCVDVPSLKYRRLQTELCTLYKIIYNLCYFENGIFTLSTTCTLSHHTHHNLVLNRPFARTNSYFYSFVPHTISIWNNLDSSLVCASLSSFQNKLHSLYY